VVDPAIGPLLGTDLLGLTVGIVTFLGMNRHAKVYSFSDESITELRKVTWPTKEEAIRSTTVCIITTFFIAATLAFYDYVWGRVTKVFLFTEG
jgi:preprotein translocase SecE subunit